MVPADLPRLDALLGALLENADMLAVLRAHGPCREHRDGAIVELELPAAPAAGQAPGS